LNNHMAANFRIIRFTRKLMSGGNIGKEIFRVVNKSKFAPTNRRVADTIYSIKRKRRKELVPAINDVTENKLLEDLRNNAWVEIPMGIESNLRQSLVEESERLYTEHKKQALVRNKLLYKDIWDYILEPATAMSKLDIDSPLIKYALADPVIRIVSNYLGELPWLRSTIITESRYKDADIHYSQKWHLDFDDVRMLKLFVYLSDVDTEEDGPFKVINRKKSSTIKNSFFHKHLKDEQIENYNENDVITMLGKKCTSFLVDTNKLYHCGSRIAEGHTRLLYTALYTVYPSIYPGSRSIFHFRSGTDMQKQILVPELNGG